MTLPGLLRKSDVLLTGGRLTPALRRTGHYLMDENHPLVLVRAETRNSKYDFDSL